MIRPKPSYASILIGKDDIIVRLEHIKFTLRHMDYDDIEAVHEFIHRREDEGVTVEAKK